MIQHLLRPLDGRFVGTCLRGAWFAAGVASLLSVSVAQGQSGPGGVTLPSSRFSPQTPNQTAPAPAANPNGQFGGTNGLIERLTNDRKSKALAALEKGRAAIRGRDYLGAISWYQKARAENVAFGPGEYSLADLEKELRAAGYDPGRLTVPNPLPVSGMPQLSPFEVEQRDGSLPNRVLGPSAPPNSFASRPGRDPGPNPGPNLGTNPGAAPAPRPLTIENRYANAPNTTSEPVAPMPRPAFPPTVRPDEPATSRYGNVPAQAEPPRFPTPPSNPPGNRPTSPPLFTPPPAGPNNAPPLPVRPIGNQQGALEPARLPDVGASPLPMPNRNAPVAPTHPKLPEVRRLVSQAQFALDRGEAGVAKTLVEQAIKLDVPETAFGPNELRPWKLQLEVDQALKRPGRFGVQQVDFQDKTPAAPPQTGRYPVVQGLYSPANDRTRTMPAQAETPAAEPLPIEPEPSEPAASEPAAVEPPVEASPAPPPEGSILQTPPVRQLSEGERLFREGMMALKDHDSATAYKKFQDAWKFKNELNPFVRAQLQDKLATLRPAGNLPKPVPKPTGPVEPSPLDAVANEQRFLRDSLFREVTAETAAIKQMWSKQPEPALERAKRLRDRVNGSNLDSQQKKQLLVMVDRTIDETESYIKQNQGKISLDRHNQEVMEARELDQKRKLEVQNKIAQLVERFNTLEREQRYSESEIIAKQVKDLDPNSEIAVNLTQRAAIHRRVAEQETLKDLKAESFLNGLADVERSIVSGVTDEKPLNFGNVTDWTETTKTRMRWLEQQSTRLSPAEREIQKLLKTPVDVRFSSKSLQEVLDTLSKISGVPMHLDPQGLASEGVATDTPITLRLNQQISLQSALNLILAPLRLSYVIQNEVLFISSEQTRKTNVYTKVYNVADLVIPIPNFVPSYFTGLPDAIRNAHQGMYTGFGTPPAASGVPLTLAQSEGPLSDKASVLAQMTSGGPGGLLGKGAGSRPNRSTGYGPGGSQHSTSPDYDTLIELITTTVSPDTWDEVGGHGSVQPFPTNLSLVISQTQDVHEQIADLLDQLRRLQDLQVTIEIRFIALNDDFFERIGIDFDFQVDDNTAALPPDDSGPSVSVGLNQQGFTADLDYVFNQGNFGASSPQFGRFDAATAANFGFAILSDVEMFFLIQAAQGDQRSNTLQAPKVTLFNGQSATVSDSSQRPFVTGVVPVVSDFAAAHQPVIVVLSEGTTLNVQAVVSPDRRFVRMTLVPFFSHIGEVKEFTFNGKKSVKSSSATSSSTPNDSATGTRDNKTAKDEETVIEGTTVQLPTFAFTSVATTVSVPDGGTILLGGIKRLREGRTERGVPMLNKLPYISRLFKNVGIGREAQSLMMTVTPRIIIQEEEEQKLGIQIDRRVGSTQGSTPWR